MVATAAAGREDTFPKLIVRNARVRPHRTAIRRCAERGSTTGAGTDLRGLRTWSPAGRSGDRTDIWRGDAPYGGACGDDRAVPRPNPIMPQRRLLDGLTRLMSDE